MQTTNRYQPYDPYSPYGFWGRQICEYCGCEVMGENAHQLSNDFAFCRACGDTVALSENLNGFFAALAQAAKAAKKAAAFDEMVAKLDRLQVGVKVRLLTRCPGKVFEVLHAEHSATKLHRTDVTLLEVGVPASEMIPGCFLAAGTMIEKDNRLFESWFARKSDVARFEIVVEEAAQSASTEALASFCEAVVVVAEQMVLDQAVTVAAAKPAKKVTREMAYEQVLARKEIRDYVVYTVLSGDGHTQYQVTLADGRATGCTCRELPDGRVLNGRCYHMTGAESRERFEQWWNAPLPEAEQVAEGELIAEVVLGEDAAQHIADDLADLIDETPEEHAAYRAKLVAEQKPVVREQMSFLPKCGHWKTTTLHGGKAPDGSCYWCWCEREAAAQVRLAAEVAACEAARERRMAAPLNNNSGFSFLA